MKKAILIYLVCMASLLSAQKGNTNYRGGEVECLVTNYEFKLIFPVETGLQDQVVQSGSKVYVCESSLPLVVQIIDKTTNSLPIGGTAHTWAGPIDGNYGGIFEGKVTSSNFQNKNVIKYEFADASGTQKLTLNLFDVNLSTLILDKNETHKRANLAFDENSFQNYPFYISGKPWKYLSENQSDLIVLDNKIAGIENVEFIDAPVNNAFSYTGQSLELSIADSGNGLSTPFHNEILGCENIHLVNANAYPQQNIDINVLIISDTDDDIANYCLTDPSLLPDCITPINDANHDCILVGQDGSLDLYDNITHYRNSVNDNTKPNDRFIHLNSVSQPHTLRIKPSFTPILENPYYCNSIPLPNHTHANLSAPNISGYESALNTVYNKVGVTINLNFLGHLHTNIDSKVDDNKISSPREQITLHGSIFGYDVTSFPVKIIEAPITEMWFSTDILSSNGQSYGRATGDENAFVSFNTLSLNKSFPDSDLFYTSIHELGHAKFDLWHPDDIGGEEGDDLPAQVHGDSYNFMNSSVNRNLNLDEFRIRKYQWEKIKN